MTDTQAGMSKLRYDALDRCTTLALYGHAPTLRFYQQGRLSLELQGVQQRVLVRTGVQLLAQRQTDDGDEWVALLATDQQQSPLQILCADEVRANRYAPYGHCALPALPNAPGFNGEFADPLSGHYLLASYRSLNTVLMRFTSPDSWSPFGKGGPNPYCYCSNDPVNRTDPSGHFAWGLLGRLGRVLGNVGRSMSRKLNGVQKTKVYNSRPLFDDPNVTAHLFDEVTEDGLRINIRAHGQKNADGTGSLLLGNYADGVTGKALGEALVARKITEKASSLRTLTCHSANGGANSFAQGLADATQLPVDAFKGSVIVNKPIPGRPELFTQLEIEKGNWLTRPFVYRPKTFYPASAQANIRR